MKAFGNVAMIPINSKERVIDRHISQITKQISNPEIILSIGYDSHRVQSYVQKKYKNINIRCVENTQHEESSVCESLRLAINNTYNNRILIISGNMIYDDSIFDNIIENEAVTAISEKEINSTLDIGANIDCDTENISHISYGLINNKWSELIYLSKDSQINEIKRFLCQKEFKNKILYELINTMIKKRVKIKYINTTAPMVKINNKE
jgi:choline kinase